MFSLKSLTTLGKIKKRPHFIHTNKNVIYMQEINAYIQKHLIEKETVNCRMSEQSVLFR